MFCKKCRQIDFHILALSLETLRLCGIASRCYLYQSFHFVLLLTDIAYAESKCYRKKAPTSTYSDATALIRSDFFNPSGCQVFRLVFWYLFSAEPVLSDNKEERYALEVLLHYSTMGNALPNRQLWGTPSDYSSFTNPNEWNRGVVEFSVETGGQFTLNFFAHHNDNCTKNVERIVLDTITIYTGTVTIELLLVITLKVEEARCRILKPVIK